MVGATMPEQRVQFGSKIISSPDLDWETILALSKIIKKFAKWDPQEKKWIATWRLFPNRKVVIEGLQKFVERGNDLLKGYIEGLLQLIEKLVDNVPAYFERDGYIELAVLNCDPFELLKNLRSKFDANLGLKIKSQEIESVGEIEIPFLMIDIGKLALANTNLEKLLKPYINCFKKESIQILQKVTSKVTKIPSAFIKPRDSKHIVVYLPSNTGEGIINKIVQLGVITYYTTSLREGKVKKEARYYKLYRNRTGITIILPNYALGKTIRILEESGYLVDLHESLKIAGSVEVNGKFELFDYQKEALQRWISNNFWGTIAIPTGGGKTFIGLAAINQVKKPAIVFVPNLWLLYQWIDRINEYLGVPKPKIGILGGGEKKISEITVSTYQTGYKRINEISDKFDLVIFDEAHHVPATTFKNIALYMRATNRLALSATPKRADNNEILLFKLAGKIVYEIDYKELVKRGVVAPLIYRKILVELPEPLIKEYNKIRKKLNFARDDIEKTQILNKLIELSRDNPNKLEVIREVIRKHPDEKFFIFAGSIAFAKEIERELKTITRVALLTSETKKSEEKRIIKSFINNIIKALILVKKGEEGVDIGDASVAIITGGSKQKREIIQRIGRVLRGGENKLAWVYEIVTKNTIEEQLSKSRGIEKLIRGLESFVKRKYGVEPIKVIYWNKKFGKKLE